MPDLDPKRIAAFIEPFRVEPGRRVRLPDDFPTSFDARGATKAEAKAILREGIELLAEYQARLAAQDSYGVLVILQAIDGAGKDGTIRHVMSGVNPQGVQVSSFKVPSSEELDHDYLWRYARKLPARGDIGIFNRSYYEEVLVVRVHPGILDGQKLPAASKRGDLWKRRFREINDWERYLVDQGFRIVKLFLNLSKEEQRRRFLARIDLPEKNWKFSASDAKERAFWDDYQKAFSDVLSETSTPWAPWWVVPADQKPFARLVAAGVIADALIRIDPHYPEVSAEARAELQAAKVDLEAEAPEGGSAHPSETGAPASKASKGPEEASRKGARAERKAARRAAKRAAKAAKAERKAAEEAAKAEKAAEAERKAARTVRETDADTDADADLAPGAGDAGETAGSMGHAPPEAMPGPDGPQDTAEVGDDPAV